MTRDQLLGEIARAVRAAWPDRADELLLELERRLPPDGFEKIHRRIGLDPLTGLWSKAAIHELLRTELRERTIGLAPQDPPPLCVLMGDLDWLKKMNDQYGHPPVDYVLQETATRLKSALPEGEVLGRIGGEEFATVLALDLPRVRVIAEKMRAAIADQSMWYAGDGEAIELKPTISIGLVEWQKGMDEAAVWRAVEEITYEAKRLGRNRVAG